MNCPKCKKNLVKFAFREEKACVAHFDSDGALQACGAMQMNQTLSCPFCGYTFRSTEEAEMEEEVYQESDISEGKGFSRKHDGKSLREKRGGRLKNIPKWDD